MSIETEYKVTISVTAEESRILNVIFDSIKNGSLIELDNASIDLIKKLKKAFPFILD